MISPENARATDDQRTRGAVRRRQLDARGAAGDQPAGQPDPGEAVLVEPPGAPRLGAAAAEEDVIMTEQRFTVSRPLVPLDPLGDAEQLAEAGTKHNRAKVGSAARRRCSTPTGRARSWTCPQFTVMPAGLDDWDRIWARRDGIPHHPRAAAARGGAVACSAPQVEELRPFPWQPKQERFSRRRATTSACRRGCSRSGCAARGATCWRRSPRSTTATPTRSGPTWPVSSTSPATAAGRVPASAQGGGSPAVPARYLLACIDGHLDEFPYDLWVHRGQPCAAGEFPALKMDDRTAGKGAGAVIACASCGLRGR